MSSSHCNCIGHEHYRYTGDLMVLDGRRPSSRLQLPDWLTKVVTPLVWAEWYRQLQDHPDSTYKHYILEGIRQGFRVGFRYGSYANQSTKKNMRSALDNPEVVDRYLANEVGLKRVVGPIVPTLLPTATVSSFGVIPKPHQPGKFRLILDLSRPKGCSVNDGIEPEVCSLSYASVDQAVRIITREGRQTQMAKFDIESAYRLVPVHPDDRPLLGMKWRDFLYVDTALPFGLRSAPKIFNALADALEWIMRKQGVRCSLHYLDDFIVFGRAEISECQRALDKALHTCQSLGVPIAGHKTEGPATTLTFLGIELDSQAMEVRLPATKLQRLKEEISRWRHRRSCTKRELLSLVGQLQHACCVVKPGRTFLRRMITLSASVRELHYNIRLNKEFRSDLEWWACFLPAWNGVGMMSGVVPVEVAGAITSDASGSWGCGAFSSEGDWFQLRLPESWSTVHISAKELLPIVIGAALWGGQWQGKSIKCWCDNAAVVSVLRSGWSKDERLMHLMRCLFFVLAHHNISITGQHIPGVENRAADALSRNNVPLFFSQVPAAKREPSAIPQELIHLLVHSQCDWMSESWTSLWTNTLQRV